MYKQNCVLRLEDNQTPCIDSGSSSRLPGMVCNNKRRRSQWLLDQPGEKLCIKNYGSAIMVEWSDGRMASDALKLRILENVS